MKEADAMYQRIHSIIDNMDDLNVGTQLEIYSLELKLFKLQGKKVNDKLKKIQLKLPLLEN